MINTPKPPHLSEILKDLEGAETVSVGELAKLMGERAFGALMFIFAVPNVLPVPPGTSAILGFPLLFLTYQLMVGRQDLWLPKSVAQRPVSGDMLTAVMQRTLPWLVKIEKILKPRFSPLIRSDVAERILGLVCFLLALVLFLPIPFGNMLPGLTIAVLALALAERDGLAVIVGYALAASCAFVLWLVSAAIWAAIKAFFGSLIG